MTDQVLNIVEVPDANGRIRYRYARRSSADGKTWVRHGRYVSYHPNGAIESEGYYENDLEEGLWRDFYPSGAVAAEGNYKSGKEDGLWRFWNQDGEFQEAVVYRDGQEVMKLESPPSGGDPEPMK